MIKILIKKIYIIIMGYKENISQQHRLSRENGLGF